MVQTRKLTAATEADAVAFADAAGRAFSRRYGAEEEGAALPPGSEESRLYTLGERAVRVGVGRQSGSWIVTVVDAPAGISVDDEWPRIELRSRSD